MNKTVTISPKKLKEMKKQSWKESAMKEIKEALQSVSKGIYLF